MANIKIKHLYKQIDRHGKTKYYARIGHGRRIQIKSDYGTAEFLSEHQEALKLLNSELNNPAIKPEKPTIQHRIYAQNTIGWAIKLYTSSGQWLSNSEAYRNSRGKIYEKLEQEFGHSPLKGLNRATLQAAFDKRAATPAAANTFIKSIKAMLNWLKVRQVPIAESAFEVKTNSPSLEGFHTWTREELEKFRSTFPIGTMPRLAIELLLHTGLRRQDVVRLSPSHRVNNDFNYRPGKTVKKTGKSVKIPISEYLDHVIANTPRKGFTYIETIKGTPYTPESFGNAFQDWTAKAGVPGSAHGIRKLASVILAEAGASDRQLMAAMGWNSPAMAQVYTRKVENDKLSVAAWELMENKKSLT